MISILACQVILLPARDPIRGRSAAMQGVQRDLSPALRTGFMLRMNPAHRCSVRQLGNRIKHAEPAGGARCETDEESKLGCEDGCHSAYL